MTDWQSQTIRPPEEYEFPEDVLDDEPGPLQRPDMGYGPDPDPMEKLADGSVIVAVDYEAHTKPHELPPVTIQKKRPDIQQGYWVRLSESEQRAVHKALTYCLSLPTDAPPLERVAPWERERAERKAREEQLRAAGVAEEWQAMESALRVICMIAGKDAPLDATPAALADMARCAMERVNAARESADALGYRRVLVVNRRTP